MGERVPRMMDMAEAKQATQERGKARLQEQVKASKMSDSVCLFVCSFPLLGPVFAQVDNALW